MAAKDGETLVVVTADHETGGLTLVDGDLAEGRIDVSSPRAGIAACRYMLSVPVRRSLPEFLRILLSLTR